ncbi:hypothetical protein F4810DRAFT_686705 [Camillea tinctor]|nr:hypothetical protein F4810DRAFT_686705 [Camillea tinctor]
MVQVYQQQQTSFQQDGGNDDAMSIQSSSTLVQDQDNPTIPNQRSSRRFQDPDGPVITIHPLKSEDGAIIKIQPPEVPKDLRNTHVPCDIVLVIDVSGSMKELALARTTDHRGETSSENLGITKLDLAKHAAHTIVQSLDEGDRLGIVAFSDNAKVVQELVEMTRVNKESTKSSINKLVTENLTNLVDAIQFGMKLFGNIETERVPAMMILTDGYPNVKAPPKGYVDMIKSIKKKANESLPATIHTFGFGYHINSGLLKSIAEVGGGNYSFIPDSSMMGTVLIHAVAHLQTTYATKCTIEVEHSDSMNVQPMTGPSIADQAQQEDEAQKDSSRKRFIINLGNLQYGQSRDIYLRASNARDKGSTMRGLNEANIYVQLRWSRRQVEYFSDKDWSLLGGSHLPDAEVAYHLSRVALCDFLSSFFPFDSADQYDTCSYDEYPAYGKRKHYDLNGAMSKHRQLLDVILERFNKYKDVSNRSIKEDLEGQVSMALESGDYFMKWGRHWFLSLWNAHAKQMRNSFKDKGPQQYNKNKFFETCEERLNCTFNELPAPRPSRVPENPNSANFASLRRGNYSMRDAFNNPSGPCFENGRVKRPGDAFRWLSDLRRGDYVETLCGPKAVVGILKTPCNTKLRKVVSGDGKQTLLLTDWHPIFHGDSWVFPFTNTNQCDEYEGYIYSLVLEQDPKEQNPNPDAHSVNINGVWCATLGHGITEGTDMRAHKFLGDWRAVMSELEKLWSGRECASMSSGTKKGKDGLVCGFEPLAQQGAS